jgi:GTPase Era involved in 16S rRNA processing
MTVKKNKTLKRLGRLRETVDEAISMLNQKEESDYIKSIRASLVNMQLELAKLDPVFRGDRPAVVGVFGCPSRGKSTLLNVLLGTDILPMNSIPGTTRLGTKISYKYSESETPYILTKRYGTKKHDSVDCKEGYLKTLLSDASKEANFDNPDINSIEVEGPFNTLLGDKTVLVDTPGAELGAKKEDLVGFSNHDYEADTNRALEILNMVDIVIFCMRLTILERATDADFYREQLKNRITLINVITAGDMRDGKPDDAILLKACQSYQLQPKDTVIVSSTEALKIINENKDKNKSVMELVNSKFNSVNLVGFKRLKNKIEAKIGDNGVLEFENYYCGIVKDAKTRGIELPKLEKPSNKIGCLIFIVLVIVLLLYFIWPFIEDLIF